MKKQLIINFLGGPRSVSANSANQNGDHLSDTSSVINGFATRGEITRHLPPLVTPS